MCSVNMHKPDDIPFQVHAWPFIVLYMVFIFIAWKKSISITTYQANNHNSSQTTQQPGATAIIQEIEAVVCIYIAV